MKFFIPCFLLMFGYFQVSAQNDSLINVLEKTLQEKIDDLGAEHPDIAVYSDSLGKLYMKVMNFTKADDLFSKALDIKIKNKTVDALDIANSYYDLGSVRLQKGKHEEAMMLGEKALSIRLEVLGEKHLLIAKSYIKLGIAYFHVGNFEKAISSFNKALKIRLEILGEKHSLIADCYNNLGNIYWKAGDYEKATHFQYKALNIRLRISGENHLNVAGSYHNLGLIYVEMGDYEKATHFQYKALNIRLRISGENHLNVAGSYHNLGLIYEAIGDYEKAISFEHKALSIKLKRFGEMHPDVAGCYNNLGIIYERTGAYEKATHFHNKALSIRLKVLDEKHFDIADSYDNLAVVYQRTLDHEKAIEFHNKALNIYLDIYNEKHPRIAKTYKELGIVYQKEGNYEKAINFHDKALKIRLELFGEEHPDVAESHCNIAVLFENTDQYKTADSLWHIAIPQIAKRLKSTYLFLENNQSIKYSNKLSPTIDDFYSFTAIYDIGHTTQLATDLLLNTKSLALEHAVSTQQLVKKINDSTLSIQYEQLNNLGKQIANIEQLTNKERRAKGLNLSEIRDKREKLALHIFQHPQLKPKLSTKDIKWQDIQHHLKPEEITIDFLKIYEKKDSLWTYYAILIHKNYPSPQLVRIADEKTLTKLLKTGKNERPYYLNDRRSAKALYKILWQPIGQYLQDTKTVHISPSGILHRVPFESFRDAENEYLSARYEFHYYPTIRDILKEKPQKNTYKDIVLMGHILYDLGKKDEYKEAENDIAFRGNSRDSIQPLPQTLREVIQIKRTAKRAKLKTKLLTIDAASEDAVQRFVKDNAPSIFHFATHGVFLPRLEKENSDRTSGSRDRLRAADNPLQRSALMLYGANETWTKGSSILGSGEDGILTALEVSTLDLQNTDLVVLSACSTGLGNIHNTEGVFGLQRAFKLAGVNYVIASLWNVDDKATKNLMVKFYENLLQKKQDPATALRHAKKALREAGYQPQDWAGFILIE